MSLWKNVGVNWEFAFGAELNSRTQGEPKFVPQQSQKCGRTRRKIGSTMRVFKYLNTLDDHFLISADPLTALDV